MLLEQRQGRDLVVLHLEPDGALEIREALEAQPLDEARDGGRADARLAGDVLDAAQRAHRIFLQDRARHAGVAGAEIGEVPVDQGTYGHGASFG